MEGAWFWKALIQHETEHNRTAIARFSIERGLVPSTCNVHVASVPDPDSRSQSYPRGESGNEAGLSQSLSQEKAWQLNYLTVIAWGVVEGVCVWGGKW